jgi:hypothetical protein
MQHRPEIEDLMMKIDREKEKRDLNAFDLISVIAF